LPPYSILKCSLRMSSSTRYTGLPCALASRYRSFLRVGFRYRVTFTVFSSKVFCFSRDFIRAMSSRSISLAVRFRFGAVVCGAGCAIAVLLAVASAVLATSTDAVCCSVALSVPVSGPGSGTVAVLSAVVFSGMGSVLVAVLSAVLVSVPWYVPFSVVVSVFCSAL